MVALEQVEATSTYCGQLLDELGRGIYNGPFVERFSGALHTMVSQLRGAARELCPAFRTLYTGKGNDWTVECRSGYVRGKEGFDVRSKSTECYTNKCQRCGLYRGSMEANVQVIPPGGGIAMSHGKYREQKALRPEHTAPLMGRNGVFTPEQQEEVLQIMEEQISPEEKLKMFDYLTNREEMRRYPGVGLGSKLSKWFSILGVSRKDLWFPIHMTLAATREAIEKGSDNSIYVELFEQFKNWLRLWRSAAQGYQEGALYAAITSAQQTVPAEQGGAEATPAAPDNVVEMPAPAVVAGEDTEAQEQGQAA
jgi:hypothetical protein